MKNESAAFNKEYKLHCNDFISKYGYTFFEMLKIELKTLIEDYNDHFDDYIMNNIRESKMFNNSIFDIELEFKEDVDKKIAKKETPSLEVELLKVIKQIGVYNLNNITELNVCYFNKDTMIKGYFADQFNKVSFMIKYVSGTSKRKMYLRTTVNIVHKNL